MSCFYILQVCFTKNLRIPLMALMLEIHYFKWAICIFIESILWVLPYAYPITQLYQSLLMAQTKNNGVSGQHYKGFSSGFKLSINGYIGFVTIIEYSESIFYRRLRAFACFICFPNTIALVCYNGYRYTNNKNIICLEMGVGHNKMLWLH